MRVRTRSSSGRCGVAVGTSGGHINVMRRHAENTWGWQIRNMRIPLVMMKLRKMKIERTRQNKTENKAETEAAINFSLELLEKSSVKLYTRDEGHMDKRVRL